MTLIEMVKCMLIGLGCLKILWGKTLLIACYILNRILHPKINKTPLRYGNGGSPTKNILRLGVVQPLSGSIKPHSFSHECVFIGYTLDSATYRFLKLEDSSLVELRHAYFFKDVFLSKTRMTLEPSSSKSV